MKWLICVLALVAAGCSSTGRTQEKRVLERVETPTANGGKITRETERTDTDSETVTKADLTVALQAAMAGLRGDLPGAVAALVPKPPGVQELLGAIPQPKEEPRLLGLGTQELIGIAGALWAGERGVSAWHKRRRLATETKPKR